MFTNEEMKIMDIGTNETFLPNYLKPPEAHLNENVVINRPISKRPRHEFLEMLFYSGSDQIIGGIYCSIESTVEECLNIAKDQLSFSEYKKVYRMRDDVRIPLSDFQLRMKCTDVFKGSDAVFLGFEEMNEEINDST